MTPTELRIGENHREKCKTSKKFPNNLTTEYTDQTWHAGGHRRPFFGTCLKFLTNLRPPELFDTL